MDDKRSGCESAHVLQSVDKVALQARPSHCGRRQGARPTRIPGFGEGAQRRYSVTRAGRRPDGLDQRAANPRTSTTLPAVMRMEAGAQVTPQPERHGGHSQSLVSTGMAADVPPVCEPRPCRGVAAGQAARGGVAQVDVLGGCASRGWGALPRTAMPLSFRLNLQVQLA